MGHWETYGSDEQNHGGAIAATVVIILIAAIGLGVGFCQYSYYGEAREVRRLARAIDGVEVLEVDGNHDMTLESLWLDIRYRGERLYFSNVTPESFKDAEHICVAQVGVWLFPAYGYDAGKPPLPEYRCVWGGGLDFGSEGGMGRRMERPIRSIPEFLKRLPEVREMIAGLPELPPGIHIGDGETRSVVTATGETSVRPWSRWVYLGSCRRLHGGLERAGDREVLRLGRFCGGCGRQPAER